MKKSRFASPRSAQSRKGLMRLLPLCSTAGWQIWTGWHPTLQNVQYFFVSRRLPLVSSPLPDTDLARCPAINQHQVADAASSHRRLTGQEGAERRCVLSEQAGRPSPADQKTTGSFMGADASLFRYPGWKVHGTGRASIVWTPTALLVVFFNPREVQPIFGREG